MLEREEGKHRMSVYLTPLEDDEFKDRENLGKCPKCGKVGCTCDPETCDCEPSKDTLIKDFE